MPGMIRISQVTYYGSRFQDNGLQESVDRQKIEANGLLAAEPLSVHSTESVLIG